MSSEATYTIGKVVKLLQNEYPDLSVSKVRFLEAEGLLNPVRTKSGYRLYSDTDISRLKAVLQLQRDHFYPLSVIKEKLLAFDNGEDVLEISAQNIASSEMVFGESNHSVEAMAEKAEVPVAYVKELIEAGFIELIRDAMGRQEVRGSDLGLIKASYELASYGLDLRYQKMHIQRVNRDIPYYKQTLGIVARSDSDASPEEVLEKLVGLNNTVSNTLIRNAILHA